MPALVLACISQLASTLASEYRRIRIILMSSVWRTRGRVDSQWNAPGGQLARPIQGKQRHRRLPHRPRVEVPGHEIVVEGEPAARHDAAIGRRGDPR